MRLAVLPGDGIGPAVIDAALPAIAELDLPWQIEFGDIGWSQWCTGGDPVPPATWKLLGESDSCLLGAITSKPAREALAELPQHLRADPPSYVSPVIQLRQQLELFANVRPIYDFRSNNYRFAVIRENTEGLYAGLDYYPTPETLWDLVKDHPNAHASGPAGTGATIRLQTREGIHRIVRFGFTYAANNQHHRVTIADKPNVLRASSTLLREIAETVANDYPDIEWEIVNVDALAMWMVTRPERFGVIIAENMFGDILSDLGAGIMGGLGLAPSANLGDRGSYFEPVHGSAPAMPAGRANPTAAFLTIAEIASHRGHHAESDRIRDAVRTVIEHDEPNTLTYDLGGSASTAAAAILERLT